MIDIWISFLFVVIVFVMEINYILRVEILAFIDYALALISICVEQSGLK